MQDGMVIGADRRPSIMAKALGSMLQKVREIAELSYDEAAAQLGFEADWLIRVETGLVTVTPEEVARILVGYGAREARVADQIIDMARRAADPPPWLARHTSRLTAAARDVILLEAQATLAQVHGCRLIPYLAMSEGYFREIAPGVYPDTDPDAEWDLISSRQAHQPAGVTRLLEVIIDESAFMLKFKNPEALAGQLRHLLDLDDSPHATVRVIPWEAPIWEQRTNNFDILSFAGTTDRIGVSYTIIGYALASGEVHDSVWVPLTEVAADREQSRAILQRYIDDPRTLPF